MLFGLFKKNENQTKNPMGSDEYERLFKRIIDVAGEIGILKANLELTKTDLANLRGKFNQRLRSEPDQQTDTGKKLNEDYP